MKENFSITKALKNHGYSNIDIDQIFNYLETLEFDLEKTIYVGQIFSKNERIAKYLFFRDQFKMDINSLEDTFHINEILDQCIDWSEFWRLLVVKKGFCCIFLPGEMRNKKRFIFLAGPNILCEQSLDLADSIYEY